jgi:fatty acid desaturase
MMMPVGWAVMTVGLPAWPLFGAGGAVLCTALWLAGYLLVLPVIRFLGETSEHVYTGAESVFDATVSNLGRMQRLFIHPHNDGYHTVHHLWPGIPHHALRGMHELLMVEDWDGYGRRLRHRTRLLEAAHSQATSEGGDR